jgi:hypothetical protein
MRFKRTEINGVGVFHHSLHFYDYHLILSSYLNYVSHAFNFNKNYSTKKEREKSITATIRMAQIKD